MCETYESTVRKILNGNSAMITIDFSDAKILKNKIKELEGLGVEIISRTYFIYMTVFLLAIKNNYRRGLRSSNAQKKT